MRTLTALVVDDSGFSRKIIKHALDAAELAQFRFVDAEDGLDALDKYCPEEIDIVFVDMHMPRMGGVEFLRRLRSRYQRRPPIVMVTAESNREELANVVNEAGVDALMLKPVNAERFHSGLKALIQSIPDRSGPWTVPHADCAAHAVQEVMAQACRLELTPEPNPSIQETGNVVFGMVMMMGDVRWSATLGFDQPAAEQAASQFAGYSLTLEHDDFGDAIGELTSIFAGYLRRLLLQRGLSVQNSFASVLSARELRFLLQRGGRSTSDQAHFRSPAGRIWVAVSTGLLPGLVM